MMIGLDTPVLLAFLHGEKSLRAHLKEWRGFELTTTEWNILELEAIARQSGRPGRERRIAALARLRRSLTVLPLDGTAVGVAMPHLADLDASPRDLIGLATSCAVEAAGGQQWWTAAGFLPPSRPKRKIEIKEVKLGRT